MIKPEVEIRAFKARRARAKDRRDSRGKLILPEPIKAMGEHTVPLKLHREVTVPLKVQVVKEGTEQKPASALS